MLTYSYRYINRQTFEGSVYYTLLIDSMENNLVVETHRIDKVFKTDAALVDSEFLREAANIEIQKIISLKEVENADVG